MRGVLGRAYIMQGLVGIWILFSLGREAHSSAAMALCWGSSTTLLAPGQWEGHAPFAPGPGSALSRLSSPSTDQPQCERADLEGGQGLVEKVTHGWAWQGGRSHCPICFLSVENPHSTRVLGLVPGTHAHLFLPCKPKVRFLSRAGFPRGVRVPRAEHGASPVHLKGPAGLPAGLRPGLRGGLPPELCAPQAPEMFILHLPVRKAIIGNQIHSPGNVTSSGH